MTKFFITEAQKCFIRTPMKTLKSVTDLLYGPSPAIFGAIIAMENTQRLLFAMFSLLSTETVRQVNSCACLQKNVLG